MTDWESFYKFGKLTEKYLPDMGEGDTMATQICTAVCKLVYKWFNDGDVYDNTGMLDGWANDISSYANWLAEYTGRETREILTDVYGCNNDRYTELLYRLCEHLVQPEYLAECNNRQAVGSVYDCEGMFKYDMPWDDEDDEDEDW